MVVINQGNEGCYFSSVSNPNDGLISINAVKLYFLPDVIKTPFHRAVLRNINALRVAFIAKKADTFKSALIDE